MSFKRVLFPALGLALATARLGAAAPDPLASGFANPPVPARPYVWWHWMGPNYSKEGITKDLEAMKASGIGGATIFNITSSVCESQNPTKNNPWPERTYRSPAYWEHMRHAVSEASRLGLEIGLHNTVGYSTTGGPWISQEQAMQRLLKSEVAVAGGKTVEVVVPRPVNPPYRGWGGGITEPITFYRDLAVYAYPAGGVVAPGAIVDLTSKMKGDGKIAWEAPAGEWRVVRIGFGPTGATPHPLPDDLIGKVLEADKMSAEVTAHHWKNVLDPLKQHLGGEMGKTFRHVLIDSYEAGSQTWTPGFREAFQRWKGYDPLPWVIALGKKGKRPEDYVPGVTVGSEDQSARFNWDFEDVTRRLYFENGWKAGVKAIRAAGLQLQFEPYGGPFDTLAGAALADLPMGEFWTGGKGGISGAIVAAARAAGRTVVGAEAFTGSPDRSQWSETPEGLKLSAIGSFGSGVNRMILHHWVHQPFDDRYKPGMGMGWWGTHFGRHQTWFRPGGAFFQYLGRTQFLLQQGEQVADFVAVGSAVGGGDAIPVADLGSVKVAGGRIVLASGRTYAFLAYPNGKVMLPETARQLGELARAGGIVVASKPERSPSLAGYPGCDAEVAALASEYWGAGTEPVRPVGRGKIMAHGDAGRAAKELGLIPGVELLGEGKPELRCVHRAGPGFDLFYVGHLGSRAATANLAFRVAGKRPELWDPETGSIHEAPVWRSKGPRTEVSLRLRPEQALFVVFRAPSEGRDPVVAVEPPEVLGALELDDRGRPLLVSDAALKGEATLASGRKLSASASAAEVQPLEGPWTVAFSPGMGAPAEIAFPRLISWADHEAPAIRYFSGSAVYRTTFEMPRGAGGRVMLDLGEVKHLAEVAVNGKALGVLWCKPFAVDIASALRPGRNELAVTVTNTWANRLIGDEQEPADVSWVSDRGPKGRMMEAYPEWFLKNETRPSANRKGFVVWNYFRKESRLLPSGLLGPVRLSVVRPVPFGP